MTKAKPARAGLGALLGAATIAGCATPPDSEAPVATSFAPMPQLKAQSSAHWSLIAQDVVDQLKPIIGSGQVHVRRAAKEETDFGRVFHAQVVSALTAKGVRVSKEPRYGVANVDIDAQLVRFSPGRRQNRQFVSATAIASGLWVLHDIDPGRHTAQIVGSEAVTATPQYELVVTAAVSNESQILGQRTDVYYIADADRSLYQALPPPPPKLTITGGD